jgi:hypothetical protein
VHTLENSAKHISGSLFFMKKLFLQVFFLVSFCFAAILSFCVGANSFLPQKWQDSLLLVYNYSAVQSSIALSPERNEQEGALPPLAENAESSCSDSFFFGLESQHIGKYEYTKFFVDGKDFSGKIKYFNIILSENDEATMEMKPKHKKAVKKSGIYKIEGDKLTIVSPPKKIKNLSAKIVGDTIEINCTISKKPVYAVFEKKGG